MTKGLRIPSVSRLKFLFGAGRDNNAGLSPQLHTAAPLLSHALRPGPSQ
jgi:hypothetical protein